MLLSMCVTKPNLVALTQTILALTGVPENFGDAGVPLPWDGGRGDILLRTCLTMPISFILRETMGA